MVEPLNCEELEVRLNELLDQRQSPENDRRIDAHIEFCPECNELVRSHSLVQDYLEDSKGSIEDMDVDVSNSVVNNWAHLFPEPKTQAWKTSSIVLVVSLLVIFPIGLIWIAWPNPPQDDPVAKSQTPVVEQPIDEKPETPESDQGFTESIQKIMGTADNQLDWLNSYRPTMQLFGVSTVIESLDLTLDLLMDRMPDNKESDDSRKSAGTDSDSADIEQK